MYMKKEDFVGSVLEKNKCRVEYLYRARYFDRCVDSRGLLVEIRKGRLGWLIFY